MLWNLLVHVDANESGVLDLALTNIENYLAALEGMPCAVTLLANAGAVKLFGRDCHAAERVAGLAARGVVFALCANALRKNSLEKKDLLDACTVVPAGMVELVRLQNAGYAYVKP